MRTQLLLISVHIVRPTCRIYCFDVFDMEQHRYLPQDQVKALAEQLGLRYVPVFYEGPFTSWEDYQPLVGKTELGGEIGEGIISKNCRL